MCEARGAEGLQRWDGGCEGSAFVGAQVPWASPGPGARAIRGCYRRVSPVSVSVSMFSLRTSSWTVNMMTLLESCLGWCVDSGVRNSCVRRGRASQAVPCLGVAAMGGRARRLSEAVEGGGHTAAEGLLAALQWLSHKHTYYALDGHQGILIAGVGGALGPGRRWWLRWKCQPPVAAGGA